MKKITAIMRAIALAFLFHFAGCATPKSAPSAVPVEHKTKEAEAPKKPKQPWRADESPVAWGILGVIFFPVIIAKAIFDR